MEESEQSYLLPCTHDINKNHTFEYPRNFCIYCIMEGNDNCYVKGEWTESWNAGHNWWGEIAEDSMRIVNMGIEDARNNIEFNVPTDHFIDQSVIVFRKLYSYGRY